MPKMPDGGEITGMGQIEGVSEGGVYVEHVALVGHEGKILVVIPVKKVMRDGDVIAVTMDSIPTPELN